MGSYNISLQMYTMRCANCGVMFGVPNEFDDQRRDDGRSFYCPNGHSNVYRDTEAKRLKRELEKTTQRLSQANERRERAEEESRRKQRKYARIRDRVKNGVCPCCNRTFQNLQAHMRTQHPDFGQDKQIKTLRLLYGLTQADLADEVGVSASAISLAERGKPVGDWIMRRLDEWLETA